MDLRVFLSHWLTWRTQLNIHYRLLDITVERIHRLPHAIHSEDLTAHNGYYASLVYRQTQGLLAA